MRKNFIGLNFIGPGYDVKDKKGSAWNYTAYMLNRTQQIFEWKNLPETVPQRSLELLLQVNGYAGFGKAPDGNFYAFWGGLGGEPDPYYMPTVFTVANPALNWSANLKIHEDVEVIPNDALYLGLIPMFSRYSQLLAENDVTFLVNDVLARMKEFITAPDDKSKAAADVYMKGIEDGKLSVIGENAFLEGIKHHSASGNERVIDFVEYAQYLKASWYNELGINANYNMKREKLNDGEVNMSNNALLPLVDNMLQSRKDACRRINELFGLELDVEFTGMWEAMEMIAEEVPEEVDPEETDPEDPEAPQEEQQDEPEQEEQEDDPEETE